MKTNKKRGSVFTLLLQNYIVFTLLFVVLVISLSAIYFFKMAVIMVNANPSQLNEYKEILENGRYEELKLKKLLGENGYIAILDEKGELEYQSGLDIDLSEIQNDDIEYIPDFLISSEINVSSMKTSSGEEHIAITYLNEYDEYNGDEGFDREYIIDNSGNIIYQTGELPMTKLSEVQFKLLSDTYYENFYIRKYVYHLKDNTRKTMLFFIHRDAINLGVSNSWSSFFYTFWTAYAILVIVFIILLKYKIERPLIILQSQLNSFKSGEISHVKYSGPKEFVEIFDSFHDMSIRLNESETKQIMLQAEKQKMLADISHDLKTPITVIKGYAKALNDGVIPQDEVQQYLKTIEFKAESLNELINNFYEFSKMEHPDYSLSFADKDICNYLRDFVASQYNEIELSGYYIEVDIPEDHIYCKIDEKQFKRVLENIINNSIKHNDIGITLYVEATIMNGNIQIILADNGKGIPSDMESNIFDPFVMAEASRNVQGSGLGLSIAKKIIEAHGGKISLIEPDNSYSFAIEILLPVL